MPIIVAVMYRLKPGMRDALLSFVMDNVENTTALQALLGNQVTMTFTDVFTAAPFVASGKLKVLGVTSAERSALLPQVRTLQEQGMKGFDISVFFALMAPSGVPASRGRVCRIHGPAPGRMRSAGVSGPRSCVGAQPPDTGGASAGRGAPAWRYGPHRVETRLSRAAA